jgi:hypothetical protein
MAQRRVGQLTRPFVCIVRSSEIASNRSCIFRNFLVLLRSHETRFETGGEKSNAVSDFPRTIALRQFS